MLVVNDSERGGHDDTVSRTTRLFMAPCGQNPFTSTEMTMTPEQSLQALKAGHDRFMAGESRHPHSSARRLKQLVEGQRPMAAILSCSDSRVPVELLFDAGFGDLYVVRTAGNTSYSDTIGSLDYGVLSLGIHLIVVMGHERCGAVTAACTPEETLTPALSDLVGTIRSNLKRVGIANDVGAACRANSMESARSLVHGSALMQERVKQGTLRIEAACYTLEEGAIEWLGAVS